MEKLVIVVWVARQVVPMVVPTVARLVVLAAVPADVLTVADKVSRTYLKCSD